MSTPETKGKRGCVRGSAARALSLALLLGNVLCAKSRTLARGVKLHARCERDRRLGLQPQLPQGRARPLGSNRDARSAVTATVPVRQLESAALSSRWPPLQLC